ncbi:MAG: ABC transporter permease, partial [Acidobacteriota bacterium]
MCPSRFAERVFAALLRAYPRPFRDTFEPELLAFFRQDLERATRQGGVAVLRMWGATLADLAGAVWRQRVGRRGLAAQPEISHSTPRTSQPGGPLQPTAPRHGTSMSDLLQDLRYGARSFVRDPGFAVVAILTLALGVGAITAVFSVIDGVLLRPLPYPDADELVYIGTYLPGNDDELGVLSEGNVIGLKQRATTLRQVAGSNDISFTLLGNGEPELIDGAAVGLDFFPMLGVQPILGRPFDADDYLPGAAPVAVLEHGFWQERFGGDAGVIGSTLTLDRAAYTIVGVAPDGFFPPEAAYGQDQARLWVPLVVSEPPLRTRYGLQALGRMAPGATVQAAAAEIDRIFRSETDEFGLEWEVGGGALTLRERTLEGSGRALWLLLLGVGFLLLIACANVAGLMLARGTRRERELAVRRSLGAGRGRVVRQLLTESVMLALAGGLAGALLSYWAVQVFKATTPGGLPRLEEVVVDLRVLSVALLLSTAVGLLFGLAPALQTFRSDASAGLRPVGGATAESRAGRRTRRMLVVAEAALTLVLLIGASLLVNSFVRVSRVDPGFDADGLIGMRVNLRSAYPDRDSWLPFFHELLQGVEGIPGVRSASLTTSLPFGGIGVMTQVAPLDTAEPLADAVFIPSTYVSPDHFRTMGMSLLEGTGFEGPINPDAPAPVIVNDAMAATYWPDASSVIGKRIRMGTEPDDEVATVIGRVNGLRYRYDREPPAEMYLPMDAQGWRSMWVTARTDADPSSLARAMREALWSVDPDIPVDRISPVAQLAWNSIGRSRFYSGLAATLAGVALFLALVGLYGTIAYTVGSRVREIGIRLALGAQPGGVVALVLR